MHTNRRTTISLAAFFVFVVGCSSSTRQLAGNNNNTIPGSTPTCTTALSAQMSLVNLNSGFTQGTSLLWTVNAQGCGNNYKLSRTGSPDIAFSPSTNFTTQLSTLGSQSVSATVSALDASGNVLSTFPLSYGPFTVVAATTTPSCPNIVPTPTSQNGTYSTANPAVLNPVSFSFAVTLQSGTTLTQILSSSSSPVQGGTLPSAASSSYTVSLNGSGSNTVNFIVASSTNLANTVNCPSVVQIVAPAAQVTPPVQGAVTMALTAVTTDGTFVSTTSGTSSSLAQANIASGKTAAMSWTTSNVNSCTLGSSIVPTSGSATSAAMTTATSLTLLCHGTVDLLPYSAQVAFQIDAPPPPSCGSGGYLYGGACFYGGIGSCNNICSAHGGNSISTATDSDCGSNILPHLYPTVSGWSYNSYPANAVYRAPAPCWLAYGHKTGVYTGYYPATGSGYDPSSYDPVLAASAGSTNVTIWSLACPCAN